MYREFYVVYAEWEKENQRQQRRHMWLMCVRPVATDFKKSVLYALRVAGNNSGCHQMPERSFFYHGKQFPVCARCTGATIGQFLSIILNVVYIISSHNSKEEKKLPWIISPESSMISMGIMGADWLVQEVGIKESTNVRRLITGILGGFGVFNMYFIIVRLIKALIVSFAQKRA